MDAVEAVLGTGVPGVAVASRPGAAAAAGAASGAGVAAGAGAVSPLVDMMRLKERKDGQFFCSYRLGMFNKNFENFYRFL